MLWYYGPATTKQFTYSGSGRILVFEVTEELTLLVDTTGAFTGSLGLTDGPLLVWVSTDGGAWTIT
ncbi:hypothetical protein G7085_10050 [Tessaracoccus sp. HDW20]|uniref:hypothetical protein n=1 Tax=Tessaracoccus coleopterorum TaxID=2714950 RepID=UPI0018D347F9|nr:hypothetical protein [Tessaracoccus coleopterorum]NHB84822.1 hypothetical protein [Tessaracoccus coleopterorum]